MIEEYQNGDTILDIQNEAKQLQVNTANDLMALYPQIQKAGFLDVYDQENNPNFTLLLIVKENLKAETLTSIQKWVDSKFEGKVDIVQVVEETI